jgi:DNA-binding NtrC family response regulator
VDSSACRILVIDDNYDHADSLAMLLGLWGYEVRAAYLPRDVPVILATFTPDVVVIDVVLPELNGIALGQAIRRQVPACIVLSTSAYADEETAARSSAAGFRAHIVKPVDLATMARLLRPAGQ